MVEQPQTDLETSDTPASAPDTPIDASSKPEDHMRVLLGAYQETLDVSEHLPAIVWIRLRRRGLGRLIKVPHLRWFLRYFLAEHIRRGLNLLNRRFHATAALTSDSEVNQANRSAVEHYLQALPPPPYKRLGLAVLVAVLAVAYPLRSLGDVTPMLSIVWYTAVSDPIGAINVLANTDLWEAAKGTIALLLVLFVVGFLPTSTFVLKRILFNLYPGAKDRLGSIAARDHVFSVEGLYTLEDRVYGYFGSRRPREFPFDLLVRILVLALVLLPLVAFAGLLSQSVTTEAGRTNYAVLAIILFIAFVFRFRRLLIAWRERNRPSEPPPADHGDTILHQRYALSIRRLQQGIQAIDPFAPLRMKKDPNLAFVLGFLFSGVGLGIYFRSWVDLVVPSVVSIVWLMLVVALQHSGLWIVATVIGGLWGSLRAVSSNGRL